MKLRFRLVLARYLALDGAKRMARRCARVLLWVPALFTATVLADQQGSAGVDGRYAPMIRTLLLREAHQQWPDASIDVVVHLDPRLRLADCTDPAVELRGQQRHGRVHVALRCGQPRAWSVNVPAEVNVRTDVLVAARPLTRGQALGQGDFRREQRILHRAGQGALAPGANLAGLMVKRSIPAGAVLTVAQFSALPAVRSGESIRLLSSAGPVRIETRGKALEDGRMGEQIRVENSGSGKAVRGWVTGPGEVSTRRTTQLSAAAAPGSETRPDLVAHRMTNR